MAEKKFVVLGAFVRQFTRGDVVTAEQLGGDGMVGEEAAGELKALTGAMVEEKSIRPASAWEAKLSSVPVEYVKDGPDADPPEELAGQIGWKGAKPKPAMAPPALTVPKKEEEEETPAAPVTPTTSPTRQAPATGAETSGNAGGGGGKAGKETK